MSSSYNYPSTSSSSSSSKGTSNFLSSSPSSSRPASYTPYFPLRPYKPTVVLDSPASYQSSESIYPSPPPPASSDYTALSPQSRSGSLQGSPSAFGRGANPPPSQQQQPWSLFPMPPGALPTQYQMPVQYPTPPQYPSQYTPPAQYPMQSNITSAADIQERQRREMEAMMTPEELQLARLMGQYNGTTRSYGGSQISGMGVNYR